MVLTNLLSVSFSRLRFMVEVRTLLIMCNDLFSGLSYGLLFRAKSILCMTVIVSLMSEVFSLGCIISSTCKEYLATDNKSETLSVLDFSLLLFCIGAVDKTSVGVNAFRGKYKTSIQ